MVEIQAQLYVHELPSKEVDVTQSVNCFFSQLGHWFPYWDPGELSQMGCLAIPKFFLLNILGIKQTLSDFPFSSSGNDLYYSRYLDTTALEGKSLQMLGRKA